MELELIRRDLRGSHARLLVTLAAVAVAVISLLSLLPAGSRPSARVAASPPSRVSSVKASEVRRRPREVNTPPNPTPRRPPATRGATPEAPPVRRAVPRDAPPPDSQTSVRG